MTVHTFFHTFPENNLNFKVRDFKKDIYIYDIYDIYVGIYKKNYVTNSTLKQAEILPDWKLKL